MKRLLFCEFNFDAACVELQFSDGSMIVVDAIAVEKEVADNMYQRSELDYLIYNNPVAYADLILNGDSEACLKSVAQYKLFDWFLPTGKSYFAIWQGSSYFAVRYVRKKLHFNSMNLLIDIEKHKIVEHNNVYIHRNESLLQENLIASGLN